MKQIIEDKTIQSIIPPGTSVGCIGSMSIGRTQTQSCLNSFHTSGISSALVVSGTPRFLELLNVSKDPKSSIMTFFLKKDLNSIRPIQTLRDVQKYIGSSLVFVKVKDLIENYYLYSEKDFPHDDHLFFHSYHLFFPSRKMIVPHREEKSKPNIIVG